MLGNARAMEEAIRIGSEARDLDIEDVRSIHRALAVAPPLSRIAGEIRQSQGWIGGSSPVHAAFVPPPHEHVQELVLDLCAFMNRDDISPVAQAAIAHAQFETIHPFGDGNGRVGRCRLIHVLFRRRAIAPVYVPPVSIVLGADKDSYIAGLADFRADEVDRWVAHFALAVEKSALESARFLRGSRGAAIGLARASRTYARRCRRPSDHRVPALLSGGHRRNRRADHRPFESGGE